MRIGVMADTHGVRKQMSLALRAMGDIDVLIHAGDCSADAQLVEESVGIRTIYVRGNCDFDYDTPDDIEVELEGWKFFITHGHGYGVKYGLEELRQAALDRRANICVFGHTHQPVLEEEGGCIILNPGSPAFPRMSKASCAVIELDESTRPDIQHILVR